MRCVFGVDGGGTSTRLRIADISNALLWEGSGKGINPNSVPRRVREQRLLGLFREGLAAVGIGPGDIVAGCMGVAGADRPTERVELEGYLRKNLGARCPLLVTTDADVALVGGLRSTEGMILVAGTGSIAIARLHDGTRVRAGGYGHFLSDEGSAFFIGFQAIRRALRSQEGRDEPTGMLNALASYFNITDTGQFVPLVYQHFDKAAIAAAATVVESFRAAGDPLAVSIFNEAARELRLLVSSVYRRVEDRINNRALLLQGGLLENDQWLRSAVTESLRADHSELIFRDPVESATFGACMLAAQMAGRA
ncbi:MAG: BadF/BadG/BcrA/BcrD ATPase family protein [Spirochaetia bacterium]|jgi:N-acetylglucosamine kinase-like BadF-type ATPase